MMNLSNIESVLKKISPGVVANFLARQGYQREGGKTGIADVYVGGHERMVLLPLNQEDEDYARRLRDLIELFVKDTLSVDDIVGTIVLPDSDILRYRISSPEADWGHLRLHYCQEAMHALFDLLQYTAAGVATGRSEYRRIPDSAKAFANGCRFGQTEYGSFILKVFCPVNPHGAQDVINVDPFGRSATRAVMENLEFLSSDRSENVEEPLPPTMNRQVASAVHRLKPHTDLGTHTEVRVRYSPLSQPDQRTLILPAESTTLELSPFIFSRAESVRDRLKKAEEIAPEVLRGHIITLHKDRPVRDNEQSQEVTLDVKYGASRRQLRVRLLPKEYRDAITWHDDNLEVDVDAVIDKRSKVWTVYTLNHFRLSNPNQSSSILFDTT